MANFLLRIGGPALLVLTVILVSQGPATAAVVVEVKPSTAPPGATVMARTLDRSMVLIPSGRLEIFLAPSQRVADTARGPEDPRLLSLGELVANERCIGRLSFTVPDVSAGDYVLIAHCAECTRGMVSGDTCSPGPELAEQANGPGTLITVGEFAVTAGSALARTGNPLLPAVAFALVLATMGIGLLVRGRSRPSTF